LLWKGSFFLLWNYENPSMEAKFGTATLDPDSSVPCAKLTHLQTHCNITPTSSFTQQSISPMTSRENSPSGTPEPEAVVHDGTPCDGCQNTVIGLRRKCSGYPGKLYALRNSFVIGNSSSCVDYDLCDNCVFSGGKDRHNLYHVFFEVAEPRRAIVHKMQKRPTLRDSDDNMHQAAEEVVTHHATCNLCYSYIEGDRYLNIS